VTTAAISGVFAVLFTFVPNEWISVGFWTVCACAISMNLAGLDNLILEQVPKHKGPMMSMSRVFQSIGLVLGVALGGLVLNSFVNNFQLLMTIFGVSALISVPILLLLAKDPCKSASPG